MSFIASTSSQVEFNNTSTDELAHNSSPPAKRTSFAVANSHRIERVPAAVFDAFLNILIELRGEFIASVSVAISERISDILYRKDLHSKYKFETIDAADLRSHSLDSSVLVDLCDTE